jgi:hypothetical protein
MRTLRTDGWNKVKAADHHRGSPARHPNRGHTCRGRWTAGRFTSCRNGGGQFADGHRGHRRAQRGGGISRQAGGAGFSGRPARSADAGPVGGHARDGDGAWIYPALLMAGQNAALVAWWFGGALRNLSFVVLPPGDRAKSLQKPARATGLGRRTGRLADRAAELASGGRPGATPPNGKTHFARRPGRAGAVTRRCRRRNWPRARRGAGRGEAARPICCPRNFPRATTSSSWTASGCAAWPRRAFCMRRRGDLFLRDHGLLEFRRKVEQQARTQRQLHQRAATQGALRGAQGTAGFEIRGAGLLENCRRATARGNFAATVQFCRRPETFPQRYVCPRIRSARITDGFYDAVRKAKLDGQAMFDTAGGEDLTYRQMAQHGELAISRCSCTSTQEGAP